MRWNELTVELVVQGLTELNLAWCEGLSKGAFLVTLTQILSCLQMGYPQCAGYDTVHIFVSVCPCMPACMAWNSVYKLPYGRRADRRQAGRQTDRQALHI